MPEQVEGATVEGATVEGATVEGVRYLQQIFPVLEQLQGREVERDRAGNRRLEYSHYVSLMLLSLFNPLLQSLRGLQQASALGKVQRLLNCSRASLGSLSEAGHVFDPAVMQPLLREKLEGLSSSPNSSSPKWQPGRQSIPQQLLAKLVAVDGTILRALPQITEASLHPRAPLGWKLHTQFRVSRGVPEDVVLTDARGQNESDERTVLKSRLKSDRLYVMDCGYEKHGLFNDIVAKESSYVCRVQARPVQHSEPQPLSTEAIAAGVVEDALVQLGSRPSRAETLSHPVRRIVVGGPVPGRPRSDRPARDQIVLLTNLLDVPAEIIALVYRHRWLIELFFRFLKHVLGCRRLLCEHPHGITLQVYCAILACLLLAEATGGSLNRRGYELVSLYLMGWAEEHELIAGLARLRAAALKPRS
jgi:IS4 transposase